MNVVSATAGLLDGLPEELRIAQEALEHPDVLDMLRRLSKYNLGISMPHMHDEDTGAFKVLPADRVQVEDGLEVTFRPVDEMTRNAERFVPVGWFWREGGATTNLICYSYCEKPEGETHKIRHRKE